MLGAAYTNTEGDGSQFGREEDPRGSREEMAGVREDNAEDGRTLKELMNPAERK